MAYNALNNLIDAYIYANGVQAITGQILNGVLKQMVSQLGSGYHLMGVAGPETVPASNDYAMAYFAATAGEYTDFGGITLAAGEVAVLLTSGNGSWSKQTIYNVPTGTADLENTANFITNAVTDLVNYYTKDEVDTTLADFPTLEALATALADYYTKTEIDQQMGDVDTALGDRYTKAETDTKLGDYYKKTETYDKDEVDSIIATLSRQEYVVAWDGATTPDVTAIPAGVTVTYSGTTYTGTLDASASTVNKIYMVWNGTAYDMYGTSADGGYSWVPMGTTTVDLSQYATKAELSQLEAQLEQKYGAYEEHPEFLRVYTDSESKILWAIKKDGDVYFGAGVPEQVKEYIDKLIDGLSLDEYDSIVSFLYDYIGGESTLKELLDSINEVIPGLIDNHEWLQVTTDNDDRVLGGRDKEGRWKEQVGIDVPVLDANVADIDVANINTLNLSENGIDALIDDLEDHGISAGGVTQEELDQQLSNYVQNTTLSAYETTQNVNQTLQNYVKTTDNVANIANGAVTVPTLSQAVIDLIEAGESGTITNNPDDVTLETNGNHQLQIKSPYRMRGAQGTGGDANGNARGVCSTDFQLERNDASQVAGGKHSFIAGGRNNKIYADERMGQDATECHAEGKNNIANSWQSHVEGSRSICDSKIGHAEGNASICSTNDGHAEGNRTVAGRVRFNVSSYGTEDAGDNLGVLNYVVIAASENDVTAYFPNALITDEYVAQHYGNTSQKDSQGNIYNSPFTPAVWNGDTLVTKNDLTWALHNVCIVRGQGESDICYARIKKAVYDSQTGTKIYFAPDDVYSVYTAIYSSYAPQVLIDGFRLGNGGHSEGYITQCAGYGAHSEGYTTKANGDGSHAEGASTKAIATSTHAEGELTIASALGAHAQGIRTTASGRGSFSMGAGSVASRPYQMSYSAHEVEADRGKRQTCEIMYDDSYVNHGWHTIPLLKRAERNRTYCIETTLLGRQIAGSAGSIGDTFAYKVTVLASIGSSGGFTPIASSSELIGRSSGMSGDGVSSGVRISVYNNLYDGDIIARLDSIDGATFRVTGYTKWIEISNE